MKPGLRRYLLFSFNSLEAIIWLTALILLAATGNTGTHYTLCPLKYFGFEFCPGCGLGRSIALILHGQFIGSLRMHPLGFPALALLLWRIISVFTNAFRLSRVQPIQNSGQQANPSTI